jgi:endonuclease YncB( thermonuclease family)
LICSYIGEYPVDHIEDPKGLVMNGFIISVSLSARFLSRVALIMLFAILLAQVFAGRAAAYPLDSRWWTAKSGDQTLKRASKRTNRLSGPVRAQIIRVIDGDSLVARARIWLGQVVQVKIRIAGIDAPEIRARCAREHRLAVRAARHLTGLLSTRAALLRDIRYGKYAGRVVARVETLGGRDVGTALVKAGLARLYVGKRRQSWCPN